MTFSLNYTKVDTSVAEADDTKTFVTIIRRLCVQTGMLADYLGNRKHVPCFF